MLLPCPSLVPPARLTRPKGKSRGVVFGVRDHILRHVWISVFIIQAYLGKGREDDGGGGVTELLD
jgi:hypothetical protein